MQKIQTVERRERERDEEGGGREGMGSPVNPILPNTIICNLSPLFTPAGRADRPPGVLHGWAETSDGEL